MKRIALAVFLVAFSACSTDEPFAPTDGIDAGAGVVPLRVTRQVSGNCKTTIEFLPPEPEQPPNVQHLRIGYTCQLRKVGVFTGTGLQTVTFNQTGGADLVNTTTYTDADGNQLFASFVGTATAPDQNLSLTFQGVETYAGGTGRFERAEGSTVLHGGASLITALGFFESSGSLKY